MKFTNKELKTLLEAQDKLNTKYSGENWRETVPLQSFVNASLGEIAEWIDCSPRVENNRWWRKDLQNDFQNQVIEIIDVLHFNLSILLHEYTVADILKANEELPDVFDFEEDLKSFPIQHIHFGMMSLIDASYMKSSGNIESLLYRLNELLASNYLLISTMAIATSTQEEKVDLKRIYKGYFLKNELNQKRVKSGYQEGNYNKINSEGEEDNVKLNV